MDDCSRQNPAYRSAKGSPAPAGLPILPRCAQPRHGPLAATQWTYRALMLPPGLPRTECPAAAVPSISTSTVAASPSSAVVIHRRRGHEPGRGDPALTASPWAVPGRLITSRRWSRTTATASTGGWDPDRRRAPRRSTRSPRGLLDDHARHCVLGSKPSERDEKTAELMAAVGRLDEPGLRGSRGLGQPSRCVVTDLQHPLFARFFDRLSRVMEKEVGRWRDQMLTGLSGRVLELGPATGSTSRTTRRR